MRHLLQRCTIAAVILLFLGNCHKQVSRQVETPDQVIQQAEAYFRNSVESSVATGSFGTRQSAAKTVRWDQATTLNWPGSPAVWVPVSYQDRLYINTAFEGDALVDLSQVTHLLVYRDSSNIRHAVLVTCLPDSSFLGGHAGHFVGYTFVEGWDGAPVSRYRYLESGEILKQELSDKKVSTVIMTCTQIDGYNYSAGDPDGGFSWSESGGCTTTYIPNSLPGLAGTSSPPPTISYGPLLASHIIIPGPTQIIANIAAYFQCFTNSSGIDHSYSVTLCVDQPHPGTRQPWGITGGGAGGTINAGNIINTGHAFFVFSENSAGTIITRNVGFFPTSIITPLNPQSQGVLSDDENHGYNISLTFNLTNDQFFAMLNYVSIGNNPGYIYDLNSNNCTTFVLHALAAGTIALSSRQGVWPDGSGYDPGDLGEDIRQMALQSTMSRSLATSAHPNTGSCN